MHGLAGGCCAACVSPPGLVAPQPPPNRRPASPHPPAAPASYGHLTWEWAAGLRSYAHPLLFAAPYALLRALRLDSARAVARLPLLLQALAAAATDAYVAQLARLLAGPEAAG